MSTTTCYHELPASGRGRRFPSAEQNRSLPRGPHRRLRTDRSTAFTHETEASSLLYLLSDKPIVRRSRPQYFNRELLALTARRGKARGSVSECRAEKKTHGQFSDNERVNKLSIQRRWTSTTREASEESALPTPKHPVPENTLELQTDPVRLRLRRYQPQPYPWQQYAREWDAMQVRRPMDTREEEKPDRHDEFTLPEIPQNQSIVMQKDNQSTENIRKRYEPSHEEYAANNGQRIFTRPMPGYGGFVPRHAVEPRPLSDGQCLTASMCSTSRRTYRQFPSEDYCELAFAHKGPLSKTVTLTYPFNPFNKTE